MRSTTSSFMFALITTTGFLLGGCDQAIEPTPDTPTPSAPPMTTTSLPAETTLSAPPPDCDNSCFDLNVCGGVSCATPCNDSYIITEENQQTRICVPTSCQRFGGCVDGPGDSPTGPGGGGGGGDSGNGGCTWSSTPLADDVFMYEHSNFGGRCVQVRGPRNQSWTEDAPFIGNDSVSSLKMGARVKVEFFDHINFVGSRGIWTAREIPYVGDAANDQMSSYKIHRR